MKYIESDFENIRFLAATGTDGQVTQETNRYLSRLEEGLYYAYSLIRDEPGFKALAKEMNLPLKVFMIKPEETVLGGAKTPFSSRAVPGQFFKEVEEKAHQLDVVIESKKDESGLAYGKRLWHDFKSSVQSIQKEGQKSSFLRSSRAVINAATKLMNILFLAVSVPHIEEPDIDAEGKLRKVKIYLQYQLHFPGLFATLPLLFFLINPAASFAVYSLWVVGSFLFFELSTIAATRFGAVMKGHEYTHIHQMLTLEKLRREKAPEIPFDVIWRNMPYESLESTVLQGIRNRPPSAEVLNIVTRAIEEDFDSVLESLTGAPPKRAEARVEMSSERTQAYKNLFGISAKDLASSAKKYLPLSQTIPASLHKKWTNAGLDSKQMLTILKKYPFMASYSEGNLKEKRSMILKTRIPKNQELKALRDLAPLRIEVLELMMEAANQGKNQFQSSNQFRRIYAHAEQMFRRRAPYNGFYKSFSEFVSKNKNDSKKIQETFRPFVRFAVFEVFSRSEARLSPQADSQERKSPESVDLEKTLAYVLNRFIEEPLRKELPTQRALSRALGPSQMTFSRHYSEILETLEKRIQAEGFDGLLRNRIQEAVTEKRQELNSWVSFDFEKTLAYVLNRFIEEPSRKELPTQSALSIALGPSQPTFAYHFPEILKGLEKRIHVEGFDDLLRGRIQQAIRIWKDLPGTSAAFMISTFRKESLRKELPTQSALSIALGPSQPTFANHFPEILEALEKQIHAKGFDELLRKRIESAMAQKSRSGPEKKGSDRSEARMNLNEIQAFLRDAEDGMERRVFDDAAIENLSRKFASLPLVPGQEALVLGTGSNDYLPVLLAKAGLKVSFYEPRDIIRTFEIQLLQRYGVSDSITAFKSEAEMAGRKFDHVFLLAVVNPVITSAYLAYLPSLSWILPGEIEQMDSVLAMVKYRGIEVLNSAVLRLSAGGYLYVNDYIQNPKLQLDFLTRVPDAGENFGHVLGLQPQININDFTLSGVHQDEANPGQRKGYVFRAESAGRSEARNFLSRIIRGFVDEIPEVIQDKDLHFEFYSNLQGKDRATARRFIKSHWGQPLENEVGFPRTLDAMTAFYRDQLAGIYFFNTVSETQANGRGIHVIETFRKRKIGTKLRENLLAVLKEKGLSRFYFPADKTDEAQGFHRKIAVRSGVVAYEEPRWEDPSGPVLLSHAIIDLTQFEPEVETDKDERRRAEARQKGAGKVLTFKMVNEELAQLNITDLKAGDDLLGIAVFPIAEKFHVGDIQGKLSRLKGALSQYDSRQGGYYKFIDINNTQTNEPDVRLIIKPDFDARNSKNKPKRRGRSEARTQTDAGAAARGSLEVSADSVLTHKEVSGTDQMGAKQEGIKTWEQRRDQHIIQVIKTVSEDIGSGYITRAAEVLEIHRNTLSAYVPLVKKTDLTALEKNLLVSVSTLRKAYMLAVLIKFGGNQLKTAEVLQVSRGAFRDVLKEELKEMGTKKLDRNELIREYRPLLSSGLGDEEMELLFPGQHRLIDGFSPRIEMPRLHSVEPMKFKLLEEREFEYVLKVKKAFYGNESRAARALRIERSTLRGYRAQREDETIPGIDKAQIIPIRDFRRAVVIVSLILTQGNATAAAELIGMARQTVSANLKGLKLEVFKKTSRSELVRQFSKEIQQVLDADEISYYFPELPYEIMNKKIQQIQREYQEQETLKTPEQYNRVTEQLKERLAQGESLDAILPEAFAVFKEASKTAIHQEPRFEQVLAALAIHQGGAIEMEPSEGKTLSIAMAAYLHALTGQGVHIHTFNISLATRDAQNMGFIFNLLGLTVGVRATRGESYLFNPEKSSQSHKTGLPYLRKLALGSLGKPVKIKKKTVYQSDITYGVKDLFVFDYLEDQMVATPVDMQQRETGPSLIILDEGDSTLLDETHEPLVVAYEPKEKKKDLQKDDYVRIYNTALSLLEGQDYQTDPVHENVQLEPGLMEKALDLLLRGRFEEARLRELQESNELENLIRQALLAKHFNHRDSDYVLLEDRVVLVDEFTGRLKTEHVLSNHRHQFIAAKEWAAGNQVIFAPAVTLAATLTYQNYYRMMKGKSDLSMITGTLGSEAPEMMAIYGLPFVRVPNHFKSRLIEHAPKIFSTKAEKDSALAEKIFEIHQKGNPLLIFVRRISDVRNLNKLLMDYGRERGVPVTPTMINGLNPQMELVDLEKAGNKGQITIATNVVGRGINIDVSAEVEALGGLIVILTKQYKSRRIDDQLKLRTAREGKPGEVYWYLSREDESFTRFEDQRQSEEFLREERQRTLSLDDTIDNERRFFYQVRRILLNKIQDKSALQRNAFLWPIEKSWQHYINELEFLKFHQNFEDYPEKASSLFMGVRNALRLAFAEEGAENEYLLLEDTAGFISSPKAPADKRAESRSPEERLKAVLKRTRPLAKRTFDGVQSQKVVNAGKLRLTRALRKQLAEELHQVDVKAFGRNEFAYSSDKWLSTLLSTSQKLTFLLVNKDGLIEGFLLSDPYDKFNGEIEMTRIGVKTKNRRDASFIMDFYLKDAVENNVQMIRWMSRKESAGFYSRYFESRGVFFPKNDAVDLYISSEKIRASHLFDPSIRAERRGAPEKNQKKILPAFDLEIARTVARYFTGFLVLAHIKETYGDKVFEDLVRALTRENGFEVPETAGFETLPVEVQKFLDSESGSLLRGLFLSGRSQQSPERVIHLRNTDEIIKDGAASLGVEILYTILNPKTDYILVGQNQSSADQLLNLARHYAREKFHLELRDNFKVIPAVEGDVLAAVKTQIRKDIETVIIADAEENKRLREGMEKLPVFAGAKIMRLVDDAHLTDTQELLLGAELLKATNEQISRMVQFASKHIDGRFSGLMIQIQAFSKFLQAA